MVETGARTFRFALVGFPGAGKSTYAAALYRAVKNGGVGYVVEKGENYLRGLDGNRGGQAGVMPATQMGKTTEIVLRKGSVSFAFKDYGGEVMVTQSTGEVTPNFCGSIIGKSEGALILINPKKMAAELKSQSIEACVKKYDPIIRYLAGLDTVQCVIPVRTAKDYYQDMERDLRKKFDEFEEALKNRLAKKNEESKVKFRLSFHDICCQGEPNNDAQHLFFPIEELFEDLRVRDEIAEVSSKGEPTGQKSPTVMSSGENRVMWIVALAVLIAAGSFLVWKFVSGRLETKPTQAPGNSGENTPTPQSIRQCGKCGAKLNSVEIGPDCVSCKANQDKNVRKALGELRENLAKCPDDAIKSISYLNEASEVVPPRQPELIEMAKEVENRVDGQYSDRILLPMKRCYRSLELQMGSSDMLSGLVPSDDKNTLSKMFTPFSELSTELGKCLNETIGQGVWSKYAKNGITAGWIKPTCTGTCQEEYEITEVSVKVDNNPYRKIIVSVSSFEYSDADHDYNLQELEKEKLVIEKEKDCGWRTVWSGSRLCKGNPWRCCGVKLWILGNNMGKGKAERGVAKVFNDSESNGQIEVAVPEFGPFKDKGPIRLSYRVSYRRLNPVVKSPFEVKGGER